MTAAEKKVDCVLGINVSDGERILTKGLFVEERDLFIKRHLFTLMPVQTSMTFFEDILKNVAH